MKNLKLITLSLLLAAFFSCSKEKLPTPSPNINSINVKFVQDSTLLVGDIKFKIYDTSGNILLDTGGFVSDCSTTNVDYTSNFNFIINKTYIIKAQDGKSHDLYESEIKFTGLLLSDFVIISDTSIDFGATCNISQINGYRDCVSGGRYLFISN